MGVIRRLSFPTSENALLILMHVLEHHHAFGKLVEILSLDACSDDISLAY